MSTTNGTAPSGSVGTCFNAQSYLGYEDEYGNGTQLNADLGGAIIACSYIAINALLPFLFVWSNNVTSSIFMLFSQTIPILIATLASIHSNNLSLFDAHFAVAVTGSPMSFYIAASCIQYPFKGKKLSLFKKIPSREARSLICILGGLLFPCLWLSVSLVTSFSPTAFRNSAYCEGVTLTKYLEFLVVSSFTGVLDIMGRRDLADDFSKRWGLGFLSLLFMLNWGAYLVHHREEIYRKSMAPIKALTSKEHKCGRYKFLCISKEYVLLAWRIPKLSWSTIVSHHPSMVAWLLLCLHWGWALGIASALTFDQTQLPSALLQGVCFTFTGRNEWSAIERSPNRSYLKWSRLRWVIVLWSAVAYMGLHAVWIAYYVKAGSMPNDRIKVNDPHKNWKPYSVCLYINGYCCSIVCIFLAVAFFDSLPMRNTNQAATPTSPYQGALKGTALVVSVSVAVLLCVSPIFAPFLALPIAQEWHWRHDCDPYPVEMILYARSNPFEEADISIYAAHRYTPSSDHPLQRAWMYNYKFYTLDKHHPNLRVVEYIETVRQPSTANSTSLPLPRVKTLLLDAERRNFIGCSDRAGALLGSASNVTIESLSLNGCTEGSGTYETQPYLRFAVTYLTSGSSSNVYLQAESKEWAFFNDAPSLSLVYTDGVAGSPNSEHFPQQPSPFRTALTKRNYPTVLKVCGEGIDISVEVLAPLSVVMDALNRFAVYISRPRVLSDV